MSVKANRMPGTIFFKGAVWGMTVLFLALLMTAGYKIGETFALNNAEEYLEVASMSPCLESGRTHETQPLIRLRFTEPIQAALVNEYHFSLRGDEANLRIPLRIAWDEATRTATLAPKRPLEPGVDYLLEVSGDLVSTRNHRVIGPFRRPLRVEAAEAR